MTWLHDLRVGGFNPFDKNISQIGNRPQIGMNTKKWTHDPVYQGYPGSWSLTKQGVSFLDDDNSSCILSKICGESSQSPNEYGFKKNGGEFWTSKVSNSARQLC